MSGLGGECGVRFQTDEGDDAVTGTVLPTVASSGISSSYSSIILWYTGIVITL